MELVILGLFCGLLLGCLSAGLPMPLALTGGLVLFLLYGAKKGSQVVHAETFEQSDYSRQLPLDEFARLFLP